MIVLLLIFEFILAGHATCSGDDLGNDLSLTLGQHCTNPLVYILDDEVDRSKLLLETYAAKKKPCFIHLGPSTIPQAGTGTFTNVSLKAGVIFGPYEVS